MQAAEIADEVLAHSAALVFEVKTLSKCFEENKFFGDSNNFRHAHFGYLMTCMAQIDVLSVYEQGTKGGKQTPRMWRFLEHHLRSGRSEEHRVAIQLLRHSLMHSGKQPFVRDTTTGAAYTWRVHFTDNESSRLLHFTLTVLDPATEPELMSYLSAAPSSVKALNIHLPSLAEDIRRVSQSYVTAMLADAVLRQKVESVYPEMRLQPFDS